MARELRRLLIAPERLRAAAEASLGDADRLDAGASDALASDALAHDTTAPGLPCPLPQGPELILREEERHYLQRVLRLRECDRVAVVDGAGSLWSAEVLQGGQLRLEQPLAAPLQHAPASRPSLRLALALPRRDVELVWRMATELGIDRLQPLQAERCQPGGRPALERWHSIVTEACEQCERLWRPELADPLPALAWLQALAGDASIPELTPLLGKRRVDGAPDASAAPREGSVALLATTRLEGIPLLAEALAGLPSGLQALTVAIGAEGGWSDEEQEAALGAGWRPVSLGPLILRSGTAAVAAAAQLCAWRTGLACDAVIRP